MRLHPQSLEYLAGGKGHGDPFRFFGTGDGNGQCKPQDGPEGLEGLIPVPEIHEIRKGCEVHVVSDGGVRRHQAVRLREGESLPQSCMEHAVHGHRGSDSQGEGQEDHGCESPVLQ